MFIKSPANLWNAIFNVPQGLTMTVAVSLFLGKADFFTIGRTFVCAYCAGVMLTLFLRVPAFGDWVAKVLYRGKNPILQYIVSGMAGGALMGVFMNLFITFMSVGPCPDFFPAFFHTLLFSMLVSAVSSCVWVWMVNRIVEKVYGPGKG